MADSLRDQLIAAGYQAPKKEDKRKAGGAKKKHRSKTAKKPADNKPGNRVAGKKTSKGPRQSAGKTASPPAADAAAIEERKKLKAKIKTLIDDNKLDAWKGEVAYRYLVDKRIRELYVIDKVQEELAARTLAITRLNGDTYVIPRATALAIQEINPQWSVFNLEAETPPPSDEGEDYAEFKVPDDLKW